MTRLVELDPKVTRKDEFGVQFCFMCPHCRLGVISVRCCLGHPSIHGEHGANVLPPDWDNLTLTPSINDEGLCRRCPGWHGFITNGEVTP